MFRIAQLSDFPAIFPRISYTQNYLDVPHFSCYMLDHLIKIATRLTRCKIKRTKYPELTSAVFVAQRRVGPSKQLKQVTQIEQTVCKTCQVNVFHNVTCPLITMGLISFLKFNSNNNHYYSQFSNSVGNKIISQVVHDVHTIL